MEEKLLKLFKLADALNEKQDKVYAQINYCANDSKKLEISIRSKEDFSYVERCEIQLSNNHILKWDNIIGLFDNYVKDISDGESTTNTKTTQSKKIKNGCEFDE